MTIHLITIGALCALLPAVAGSQAAPKAPRAEQTLVLDGLEIEFDTAGNWVRMFSTYRQPVSFPDRAGLRRAYTIAEEKGKAQIVRFMQENVTSERLIEEVSREVQQANRTQANGGESISRTTQREMIESVKEFTRSYSAGTLRGVTVLEQGYDPKDEEVWVKVGLSRKSARLGQQLQSEIANPAQRAAPVRSESTSVKGQVKQTGEVRSRRPPD